jgi:alpha-ketoglutarate-dependent taurine dioxygenase
MSMPTHIHHSVPDGRRLPLIVAAEAPAPDAVQWAREMRPWVEDKLAVHGAVLFRGFAVTLPKFRPFAGALSDKIDSFTEESSPRSVIEGEVFSSTDYPKSYPIQFHNEYSYASRWPMKLFFCCLQPSESGGETPIADSREILARLSASTRDQFHQRRVLYRRNFSPQRGVSWQTAYRTSDPSEVERYCAQYGITVEWLPGGCLRTTQVEDAIVRHPRTNEPTWFNHGFFFNARALEPKHIRDVFLRMPEDQLSTNTYFGDGAPIGEAVIEEIRDAYRKCMVALPWQTGDVLLIDNMLTSHGRSPYEGKRSIGVVMSDGCSRAELSAP